MKNASKMRDIFLKFDAGKNCGYFTAAYLFDR
jgi:hypothetical protein